MAISSSLGEWYGRSLGKINRSPKKIFNALLLQQRVTDECLSTLMTEVEYILNSRPLVILTLRNCWPLITCCCVVMKVHHYPLDSYWNPTVIATSVGSRFNTWKNTFDGAGFWSTYRHFNLDRSGKKGTLLWTILCCFKRNRSLAVSGRSAVWLRSLLTLMAECDRSRWKQKMHCCDDLWPNSVAFNCEVFVIKLCRVPLWNSCLLLIYLLWIHVGTLCQWNSCSYVVTYILMDLQLNLQRTALHVIATLCLCSGRLWCSVS